MKGGGPTSSSLRAGEEGAASAGVAPREPPSLSERRTQKSVKGHLTGSIPQIPCH